MEAASFAAYLRRCVQRLVRWIRGRAVTPDPRLATIGDLSEQEQFLARNAAFFERFANLKAALAAAFPIGGAVNKDDVPIYLLSRIAVEDFREILTLAANGMGIGVYKILRGMFERTATAMYLDHHPELADDYMDYGWVHEAKLHHHIQQAMGAGLLAAADVAEVKARRDSVKGRYIRACENCGHEEPAHAWTKVDIITMAKKVGLEAVMVQAYYLPMLETHPTVRSLNTRARFENVTDLHFQGGARRLESDKGLSVAHFLLLCLMDLQMRKFGVEEVRKYLVRCTADFNHVWGERGEVGAPIAAFAGTPTDDKP